MCWMVAGWPSENQRRPGDLEATDTARQEAQPGKCKTLGDRSGGVTKESREPASHLGRRSLAHLEYIIFHVAAAVLLA